MKINRSLYIIVGIIISNLSFSQDFHFSQYNENPSLVNPALTASRDAMRASVVYKSQWKSVTTPYTTYGASIDAKFKPSNWEQADKFRQKIYKRSVNKGSAGISFYNDKAGDGKLTTTNFNISLATLSSEALRTFLITPATAGRSGSVNRLFLCTPTIWSYSDLA